MNHQSSAKNVFTQVSSVRLHAKRGSLLLPKDNSSNPTHPPLPKRNACPFLGEVANSYPPKKPPEARESAHRRSTDLTVTSGDFNSSSSSSFGIKRNELDINLFREVVGRTVQLFNPTDPTWQISDEHVPVKMGSWNDVFPEGLHYFSGNIANMAQVKETVDMHEALGRVVERMLADEEDTLPPWAVDSIETWYKNHHMWTSRRMQVIRSYTMPIWKTRFVVPTVFIQALDVLEDYQFELSSMTKCLRQGEDGDLSTLRDLFDLWTEYVEHTETAMMLFTDVAYVLMQSYFSFEEYLVLQRASQVIQKVADNPGSIGAVTNYAGADLCQQLSTRELGQVAPDIPWEEVLANAHRSYLDEISVHLDALKTNDGYECMTTDYSTKFFTPVLSKDPANPMYLLQTNSYNPIHLEEWESHAPNHLSENSWALANRAHREEAKLMRNAFQDISSRSDVRSWIISTAKSLWKEHEGWVSSRFHVFQNYSLPLLQTRLRYPNAFVAAWDEIIRQVRNVSVLINDLSSSGAKPYHLYDLHDALVVYEAPVVMNLRLQEPVAMVLFHAYFSKTEGDKIVKEEFRRMGNNRCLDAILYYHNVVKATRTFPWLSSLELEYRRSRYNDHVVKLYQSLQMDKTPPVQTISVASKLFSAMSVGLLKELDD